MERLTIVVRADLPPGAQLAQSCHAVSEFAVNYPTQFREWASNGRNIVCLSLAGEAALVDLLKLAQVKKIQSTWFNEPDFDNGLTAIALGERAHEITSQLPLALRKS